MPNGEAQVPADHFLSQDCQGRVVRGFNLAAAHDQRGLVDRVKNGGSDVGILHGADP